MKYRTIYARNKLLRMAAYRIIEITHCDGETSFYPQVRVLGIFWKGVGVTPDSATPFDWDCKAETYALALSAIRRHRKEYEHSRVCVKRRHRITK